MGCAAAACRNSGLPTGNRDWSLGWMGAGAMAGAWGLPAASNNPSTGPNWYQFSSQHTAVIQFGFGDGTVRQFRQGTGLQMNYPPSGDNGVFQAALGMQDSQPSNFAAISP
jgi:hypothetical protein